MQDQEICMKQIEVAREKVIILALRIFKILGINLQVQIRGQQARHHLHQRQIHGQHGTEPVKMKTGLTVMW
eukprot:3318212-Karenia_brevis.AAC.1